MPEIGESVLLNYVGKLEDGREFESTLRAGSPLEVVLGKGRLLPLVEKAIYEMLPGQRRTVNLKAADAFGEYDDSLVITAPAARLAHTKDLPVGEYIELKMPQGTVRAKVIAANDDEITLDCNHELAGHDVTFDLELVSVMHPSAIQRELHPEGCACGCDKLREQLG